ncbi:uncharacterized protein [Elaeis guineensis]|uniref:Uncharacterized protein LOC105044384 n=1 Tax=Elaeis guineensis var. tenera TaxID=51953 RepID=A0A8N4I8P4_ELAGV|nr:uncharacterized protein LOC105044384 [Elaeis guineensis]
MAKRELSNTLKNLKFMQRAAQREAKPKEESVKADGRFGGSAVPTRRCIVIMEGNPHPGALKGRMSFQSFNPSIEKLNEEATNIHQMQTSSSNNDHQNGGIYNRVDGSSAVRSEDSTIASQENISDVDLKRKKPEMEMETSSPHKVLKSVSGDGDGQSSSKINRKGSYKQHKREKLDWNVLRPPKSTNKVFYHGCELC